MELTYLGGNCVRVNSKQLTLLFDPSDAKVAADVVLYSAAPTQSREDSFVIDGPGEYEIKGAYIKGVQATAHIDPAQRSTIYAVQLGGLRLAYLGNIAPKLSNEQVEELDQVDVLVVPVGGHGLTLDATGAVQIISQLEPKLVVPTHYDDGTAYEVPQDKLEVFLNEIGSKPEPVTKLKVSSADLPLETTVVALTKA